MNNLELSFDQPLRPILDKPKRHSINHIWSSSSVSSNNINTFTPLVSDNIKNNNNGSIKQRSNSVMILRRRQSNSNINPIFDPSQLVQVSINVLNYNNNIKQPEITVVRKEPLKSPLTININEPEIKSMISKRCSLTIECSKNQESNNLLQAPNDIMCPKSPQPVCRFSDQTTQDWNFLGGASIETVRNFDVFQSKGKSEGI